MTSTVPYLPTLRGAWGLFEGLCLSLAKAVTIQSRRSQSQAAQSEAETAIAEADRAFAGTEVLLTMLEQAQTTPAQEGLTSSLEKAHLAIRPILHALRSAERSERDPIDRNDSQRRSEGMTKMSDSYLKTLQDAMSLYERACLSLAWLIDAKSHGDVEQAKTLLVQARSLMDSRAELLLLLGSLQTTAAQKGMTATLTQSHSSVEPILAALERCMSVKPTPQQTPMAEPAPITAPQRKRR